MKFHFKAINKDNENDIIHGFLEWKLPHILEA